eukprot:8800528-Pyramimonas_sp.AAC.1
MRCSTSTCCKRLGTLPTVLHHDVYLRPNLVEDAVTRLVGLSALLGTTLQQDSALRHRIQFNSRSGNGSTDGNIMQRTM